MRISSSYDKKIESTPTDAAGKVGGPKGASSQEAAVSHAPQEGVKVTVSAKAQQLAKSGFDAAKVDRLKAALQAGALKPDFQLIAKKIVEGNHGPEGSSGAS